MKGRKGVRYLCLGYWATASEDKPLEVRDSRGIQQRQAPLIQPGLLVWLALKRQVVRTPRRSHAAANAGTDPA